ncbi:hypothetical protein BC941DRAFT_445716 [Chlamydoabsidia padenii]|nr:hypothetical protein BC941DRAFT_445716 [Chlamydoabsidia padenii]
METDDYDDVRWDDYSENNNKNIYSSEIYDSTNDEPEFSQDLYSMPSTSAQKTLGLDVDHQDQYHSSSSSPFISPVSITDNNTTPTNSADIPKLMTITVQDPQKYEANYIVYLVTTITKVETFKSSQPKPVRRRFQDFVWLYNSLCLELPACTIPYLPKKHRLKYVKGDRFDKDFIERRRLGLQWFLNRIARHPLLQASQYTRVFLESGDFKNDKQMQSKCIPSSCGSVFATSILKSFTKVKKPDDRFVMMKESVNKLQDNLNIVERLSTRIRKRQQGLEQDYLEFSYSIRGLSVLEPMVEHKLRQFAEATETYARYFGDLTKNEGITYLNNIRELLTYCQAMKEQLQQCDQKQLDFEALSTYLQQLGLERERLLHPGQQMGGTPSVSDFMADKMSEMKGNKLPQTRKERLTRLQFKLEQLEQDVSLANDANNTYSNQMIKEYHTFQQTRVVELKQGLAAYADCRVDFFRKSIDLWTNVLPILTSMNIDEENGGLD